MLNQRAPRRYGTSLLSRERPLIDAELKFLIHQYDRTPAAVKESQTVRETEMFRLSDRLDKRLRHEEFFIPGQNPLQPCSEGSTLAPIQRESIIETVTSRVAAQEQETTYNIGTKAQLSNGRKLILNDAASLGLLTLQRYVQGPHPDKRTLNAVEINEAMTIILNSFYNADLSDSVAKQDDLGHMKSYALKLVNFRPNVDRGEVGPNPAVIVRWSEPGLFHQMPSLANLSTQQVWASLIRISIMALIRQLGNEIKRENEIQSDNGRNFFRQRIDNCQGAVTKLMNALDNPSLNAERQLCLSMNEDAQPSVFGRNITEALVEAIPGSVSLKREYLRPYCKETLQHASKLTVQKDLLIRMYNEQSRIRLNPENPSDYDKLVLVKIDEELMNGFTVYMGNYRVTSVESELDLDDSAYFREQDDNGVDEFIPEETRPIDPNDQVVEEEVIDTRREFKVKREARYVENHAKAILLEQEEEDAKLEAAAMEVYMDFSKDVPLVQDDVEFIPQSPEEAPVEAVQEIAYEVVQDAVQDDMNAENVDVKSAFENPTVYANTETVTEYDETMNDQRDELEVLEEFLAEDNAQEKLAKAKLEETKLSSSQKSLVGRIIKFTNDSRAHKGAKAKVIPRGQMQPTLLDALNPNQAKRLNTGSQETARAIHPSSQNIQPVYPGKPKEAKAVKPQGIMPTHSFAIGYFLDPLTKSVVKTLPGFENVGVAYPNLLDPKGSHLMSIVERYTRPLLDHSMRQRLSEEMYFKYKTNSLKSKQKHEFVDSILLLRQAQKPMVLARKQAEAHLQSQVEEYERDQLEGEKLAFYERKRDEKAREKAQADAAQERERAANEYRTSVDGRIDVEIRYRNDRIRETFRQGDPAPVYWTVENFKTQYKF